MTSVFNSIKSWQEFRNSTKLKGRTIGFVPTMGALHEGHISLFNKSKTENDLTVGSIFVNPTQFNDPEDLERYPRTFEDDFKKLNEAGVDYILYPEHDEIYKDGFSYEVSEKVMSKHLCGASRPGHFSGVLTVVMKLLNIIKADKAYFGEKDYQQYILIKGMADAFFLDTRIVPCPIVRERDGLAMSSRNMLLSPEERKTAPEFYKLLKSNSATESIVRNLENNGFKVDYIEEQENRRFGAVYLGKVRLIDNVEI